MKKLLGLILSAALLTGLLTGCAGGPAENNSTNTPENTPAVSDTNTPDTSAEAEEALWPRTIVDALGHEVTIEKEPQRIIVTHFSDMEYTLPLDAPLIGAGLADSRIASSETLEPYRGKGIVDVGSPSEPNLEKILELEPDLIIGISSYNDETIYVELQKIAPTVILGGYETWEDRLRATAEVLGKEAIAETYIIEVNELIANARQELSAYSDQTFASIRIYSSTEKTLGLLGSEEMKAYHDAETGLGIKTPDNYPETWENTSLEGIAAIDPDYILLHAENKDKYDEFLEGISQQSVWNNLKAVKNDHVIYVNLSIWSGSPRGIEFAIEDILTGVTQ